MSRIGSPIVPPLQNLTSLEDLARLLGQTPTPLSAYMPTSADLSDSPSPPETLSNSSTGSASTPLASPRSSGRGARGMSTASPRANTSDQAHFVRISGGAKPRVSNANPSDGAPDEPAPTRRRASSGLASLRSLSLSPLTTSTRTSTSTLSATTTTTGLFTTTTTTTATGTDADSSTDSGADVLFGLPLVLHRGSTPSRKFNTSNSSTSSPSRTPNNSFSNTPVGVRKGLPSEGHARLQTQQDLQNFGTLRDRAQQRNALLAAIESENLEAIFEDRLKLPDIEPWARYFPVVDPEKLNGRMTEVVTQYVDRYGPDRDLLTYARWCDHHHLCMATNDAEMKRSSSLRHCVSGHVRDLCVELRKLDETGDEASLKKSVESLMKLIARNEKTPALAVSRHKNTAALALARNKSTTALELARNKDITALELARHKDITALELAQQTYASTQMMLQKTVLLSAYGSGAKKTLDRFRDKLEEAHRIQEDSVVALQKAIHTVQPRWTRAIQLSEDQLVEHCVNVFARGMTIPTGDPLPQAVTPSQLQVVWKALDRLIGAPEGRFTALQTAALGYVRECIEQRLDESN